ncbi:hypothetical protein [Limnohabitans sp. Hippo4]|uniref:hypothetical protein n=1 Tax=Limnohabitans sp. Hippo4 TaxID=1826167 RepID=UPI000D36D479|nr:hypothetical protein [Limnohabitans sp. Hippo4]PUE35525.1 hypothetical protein B9Z46_10790 [Limnohabitans sp. Hippo4]
MNEENEKVKAALAGQILSVWMPVGLLRKLVFWILIFFGAYGVFTNQEWYHWIMLIFAATMSPRLVGEVAFALGRVVALFLKK